MWNDPKEMNKWRDDVQAALDEELAGEKDPEAIEFYQEWLKSLDEGLASDRFQPSFLQEGFSLHEDDEEELVP